jgi:hypothetical protein
MLTIFVGVIAFALFARFFVEILGLVMILIWFAFWVSLFGVCALGTLVMIIYACGGL